MIKIFLLMICIGFSASPRGIDERALVPLFYLVDTASRAVNAKALSAKTPGAFRRYKYAAASLNAVSSVLSGLNLYLPTRSGVQSDSVDQMIYLMSIYTALKKMLQYLGHAKNADQLHMVLANPDLRYRLGVKNWRSAANRQALKEIAGGLASFSGGYGAKKLYSHLNDDEKAPLWVSLIGSMLARSAAQGAVNDQFIAAKMDGVFDATLRNNELYD